MHFKLQASNSQLLYTLISMMYEYILNSLAKTDCTVSAYVHIPINTYTDLHRYTDWYVNISLDT